MPIYNFKCKKCKLLFDRLCKMGCYDVVCDCGSKKVDQLMSAPAITFSNVKESSKWDNFSYRAGTNMEKAKAERRYAEEKDHMGVNPYKDKPE